MSSAREFCAQCSKVGLSLQRFQQSVATGEQQLWTLEGGLAELSKHLGCPLCRLITRVAKSGPYGKEWWQDPTAPFGCTWLDQKSDPGIEKLNYLAIYQRTYKTAVDVRQLLIRAVPPGEYRPLHSGRVIERDSPDFSLAKGWLKECEASHNTCTRGTPAQSRHVVTLFNLIDVEDLCLISTDLSPKYLALSYVWGNSSQLLTTTSNVSALREKGGLSSFESDIPKTTWDAISFTRQLGERFIWIDALCIVQDDMKHKMDAIQSMDLVYQNALATLIVASGSNANDGIPGISRPRKQHQYLEEIDQCRLLAQVHYKDYVNGSVYSSRGWTFQEQQLKARSFVFINEQIYFTCNERTFSEEVAAEHASEEDSIHRAAKEVEVIGSENKFFVQYTHSVQLYSARKLSNLNDKLAAFTGVLNVHCLGLNSRPIFGAPSEFFDASLLWQPFQNVPRRVTQLPSWSWVGWDVEVFWYHDAVFPYMVGEDYIRKREASTTIAWQSSRTWIQWEVIGSDGQITSVQTLGTPEKGPSKMSDHSNQPLQQDLVIPDRFSNIPREALTPENSLGLTHPGSLNFSTVSALFFISCTTGSKGTNPRFDSADPYPDSRPEIVTFTLLNRYNQVCGWVQLDETWRPHTGKEYEFLVLAEADYHSEYDSIRPHNGHPYTGDGKFLEGWIEFYCMMVHEVRGQLERAGVGRVMQAALADACGKGPIWKEVVLS